MKTELSCAYVTRRGRVRRRNEDALFINGIVVQGETDVICTNTLVLAGRAVFAVADGLGAHPDGHLASRFVAGEVGWRLLQTNDVDIGSVLEAVNNDLYALSAAEERRRSLGTTLSGLLLDDHRGLVFSVGDSPVYDIRDGMSLLNKDVRTGRKDRMNMCFGGTAEYGSIEADIQALNSNGGLRLFLCSDGVTDCLDNDVMISIFKRGSGKTILEDLLECVYVAGAPDNVSAILIEEQKQA